MADIAVGELAIAAQLCFLAATRYAHGWSLRVGLVIGSRCQIRLPKKIERPWDEGKSQSLDRGPKLSERHVFTLTGV